MRGFYTVYFTSGPTCGWRQVYAEIGRKKVKTFAWAEGTTRTLSVKAWLLLQPAPRPVPKRKWVKLGAARVARSKLVRAAVRATKRRPES